MSLEGSLDATTGGDGVTLTFTVENTGDSPESMQFMDGQTFDVAVEKDGSEVWRWSSGMMFTQALQTTELAPGDTMREEVTWDDADPGDYEARAWVTASDADCEARCSFSV